MPLCAMPISCLLKASAPFTKSWGACITSPLFVRVVVGCWWCWSGWCECLRLLCVVVLRCSYAAKGAGNVNELLLSYKGADGSDLMTTLVGTIIRLRRNPVVLTEACGLIANLCHHSTLCRCSLVLSSRSLLTTLFTLLLVCTSLFPCLVLSTSLSLTSRSLHLFSLDLS